MSKERDPEVEKALTEFRALVFRSRAADRIWAYRNQVLLDGGFYSSDELIDRALSVGFAVDDPFSSIRRGTEIEEGAVITGGSAITGEGVTVGAGTYLNQALVSGANVKLGKNNRVLGNIEISNVTMEDGNTITGIAGKNDHGKVVIGYRNEIKDITISNYSAESILIGNKNEFWPGLSLNIPFSTGGIRIGHHNSLGRDGGGVISSSYRFGRGWAGPVVIGNHVETTRGAEVLGFSLLGVPLESVSTACNLNESRLIDLFRNGSLKDVNEKFDVLLDLEAEECENECKGAAPVSLFGVVKIKRCLLAAPVKIKDDTRVQCSYLRDALIPERWEIYYSSIAPNDGKVLHITVQGRALSKATVSATQQWEDLPRSAGSSRYPECDADFYKDYSWDEREQS